jgi:asparagine synthase (glutamine-hydrolysing)
MCGFTGQLLFGNNATVNPDLLESRTRSLSHRGPEAIGIWNEGQIGLAHARLKLLDFENGTQPMRSPRGTVIAYNGEIYNNTELRAELSVYGYQFQTRSDTEVVLAAYDIWGTKAWSRLNGMFALAIYDPASEMLYLVRDRLGIKPLFYTQTASGIEFGSEPSAWEEYQTADAPLSQEAVLYFLRFAQPAGFRESMFAGLNVLEPGSQMAVDKHGVSSVERWYNGQELTESANPNELVIRANLNHLLHIAVGRQMSADAPVGIFLSGGIDSAILVGLYMQMTPEPPHTFTIALEGDDIEFAAARAVAKRWQTKHHEITVTPAEYFSAMRKLIETRHLPASVPNEVLIYRLAEEARQYIKVALTGEGADELFGGYSTILSKLNLFSQARKAEASGNDLLMRALHAENPEWKKSSASEFFASVYSWFTPQELVKILQPQWKNALRSSETTDYFGEKLSEFSNLEENNRFHALLEYKHLSGLLARLDGATMAASLEGRVPYTDTDLVRFMSCLPAHLKFASNQQGKRLLRQTFSEIVPLEVISRPKRAFNVPLDVLFTSEQGQLELEEMVQNTRMSEIFNLRELKMWMNSNTPWKNAMKMWLILSLSMWLNRNIK